MQEAEVIPTVSVIDANVNERFSEDDFLTFKLGQKEYGVRLLKIQEIRNYENVTQIANVPSHVKGVINLRGMIVPIIDIRVQFNLGTPTADKLNVIIVFSTRSTVFGIVADSLSDVVTLKSEQLKPALSDEGALELDYLIGVATVDKRVLFLFDIDRVLQGSGIVAIKNRLVA